ncbi:protoporphyrinogen oxidase [Peterkaempfera griseoplana]|uniref:protoporphyrinogen oxidase n=1 Tax=Peterkaempfera griseoplana TaxID=66896 RepID=UPI00099E3AC6|nr:protoporphyrinogen oxidase [Peterkaempfera griseoplana]
MDRTAAADRPSDTDQRAAAGPPRVVVVGGGVAGLAAAAFLSGVAGGTGPQARVTVLEASERFGGKLRSGEVGGVAVDLGAESMLARRPEAVELARAVGLAEELEPPQTAKAAFWTRGALRPMPTGHVMGVPGDLAALERTGVLSAEGLARARQDLELPPTEVGDDVSIGDWVAARVGREVVDRLVEPLLGGVYAGHADRISLRAAVPQLLPVAQSGGSLLEGVAALQRRAAETAPAVPQPVFQGIRGGIGRLPLAVADAVRAAGADLRPGTAVRSLRRTPDGWRLVVRDAAGERELAADAVVLAVPAPVAARLLADEAPAAAAELGTVEYAGMALVTMAFRRSELPGRPVGSGFLVPPVDGRAIKASTFSSNKWGWLDRSAPEGFLLRTSVGRQGETADLGLPDEELVARSLADLREAVGLGTAPYAAEVTRWESGLPQYPVGHQDRVRRIRQDVARHGSLALCGAVYEGVGIPACIASARQAAEAVTAALTAVGTR